MRTTAARLLVPMVVTAVLVVSLLGGDRLGDGRPSPADVALPTRGEVPSAEDDGRSADDGADQPPTDDQPARTCAGRTEPVSCIAWSATRDRPGPGHQSSRIIGSVLATVSADGRLVARDVFSGVTRWERQVDPDARLWPALGGSLPVTMGEHTMLFGVATGDLLGDFAGPVREMRPKGAWLLVAAPGRLIGRLGNLAQRVNTIVWNRELDPEERVWLPSGGAYVDGPTDGLRAVHANTGGDQWQVTLGAPVVAILRVDGNTVVATGEPRPRVVTIARTGEVLGDVELPSAASQLTVDDTGRTVIAITEGAEQARIHLLDAQTGTRRTSLPLGGSGVVMPTARSGLIAIAFARPDPTLLVLVNDGLVALRRSLDDPPRQTAMPDGRTVVVSDETSVSAWSLVTRARRWQVDLGPDARLIAGRQLAVETDRAVTALIADPQD